MTLRESVGKRVREYRIAKGMTQAELAFEANLDQADIYRIENAKRRFNSDQIEKIARALGISVYKLFEDEKETDEDILRLVRMLKTMKSSQKQKLIKFIHNSGTDINFEVLEKAIEIVKIR